MMAGNHTGINMEKCVFPKLHFFQIALSLLDNAPKYVGSRMHYPKEKECKYPTVWIVLGLKQICRPHNLAIYGVLKRVVTKSFCCLKSDICVVIKKTK